MANYQVIAHLTYADINGEEATMDLRLGPVADTSTLADMATGISGTGAYVDLIGAPGAKLTNAKLVRCSFETVLIEAHIGGGTTPSDAAFPSVQDKLRLGFRGDNGQRTTVNIPAPRDALLLQPPNDYIANTAQSDLAAFLTLCTGAAGGSLVGLADGGGNVFTFNEGGRKLQRTRKRRGSTSYITSTHVMS